LSQLDRIKSRLMTIKNESIKTKVNVKTGGAYWIIPVTDQYRLNIFSAYSKYTSGGLKHTKPLDYEITWETGTIQVIMLEYREGEDVL
jgi:hypothetical protein